ncbi:MAG: VWA domain-containing protein, partial [Dehalococcoidia bacterium]
MSSSIPKRTLLFVIPAFLLLAVAFLGLSGLRWTLVAGEGTGPSVTTNELDYAPEATVQISGSGFAANAEVTVRVTRPDLSTVTGDGSFEPWPTSYDTVVADGEGDFRYYYTLDGVLGQYLVDVLDGRWDDPLIGQAPILASATFTDSRTINSVTLNGGSSVTVAPGASITAAVTVKTAYSDNDWKSTGWRISTTSGSFTCVDTPDHTSSGTYTESFSITAPATSGIYNAYFVAYSDNGCSSGASGTKTLSSSVVVQVPNPELAASCGTDIALVIDGSSSIDAGEYAQMQAAFVAFVQAFLPETPTQFALVEFASGAVVRQGFTGNETTIINEINKPRVQPGGMYTNWQQGLIKAHDLFPNRDKPDLIIFASDGNPNYIGNPPSSASESAAVAAAVTVANDIKGDGTRIITIGIGNDLNTNDLIAISSADAMYTSGFNTLAAQLAALAQELCGGTISVHKVIDADGNLNTTNDQSNGQGWHFDASVTGGSATPANGNTGSDGFIVFAIAGSTASVNITETVQDAFALISAGCTKNSVPVGTPATNAVNGIVIGPQDIVSCAFYNMMADTDGDTVPNTTDNCPTVANPTQTNSDGDTLGDACDNCPTVTNQNQQNSDG